jgi:hypothetical protein
VPLEALLLDAYDSSGRQALCVERGDPIIEPLSSYEAAAASSDGCTNETFRRASCTQFGICMLF